MDTGIWIWTSTLLWCDVKGFGTFDVDRALYHFNSRDCIVHIWIMWIFSSTLSELKLTLNILTVTAVDLNTIYQRVNPSTQNMCSTCVVRYDQIRDIKFLSCTAINFFYIDLHISSCGIMIPSVFFFQLYPIHIHMYV